MNSASTTVANDQSGQKNINLGVRNIVKAPLMQRCVTCWALGNHFFDLRNYCYLKTSLKEAIILLIPDMVTTIKDEDKVCKKCKISLEISTKFIGECLSVQEKLKSGKYKKTAGKTVEDDINDEVSRDNKPVCMDAEEAPTISHDYFAQDKVIQQIEKTNTIISILQPNIERLKTLVNVFCKSNIAVFDQSEHLGEEAKSKRIILLGSYRWKPTYSRQFTNVKALQIHEAFECRNYKSLIHSRPTKLPKLQRSKYIRRHKCGFCSERFIKFSLYKHHLRDKHFYCKRCKTQFPDKFSQIVHNREIHVKKRKESYLCDVCGKYFTLAHKFFAHKNVHKKPELTCEKCGRMFNNKLALNRHLLTHGEKSFKCDTCFKKYRNSVQLKRHIKLVHEPKELDIHVQCDECGKLLKNEAILTNHKLIVHSGKGPYDCPECDRTYTAKRYLQRHIKRIHRGDKRSCKKAPIPNNKVRYAVSKRLTAISPRELLPCKICGKYYKGFNKLKLHLERHVPTKRFACDYCGITLKNVNCLNKHRQLHLSAKSIHRCHVCWKTFSSEEERKDHMVIHDKPRHQCEECGEYFHRKFLLNDHVLIYHTNRKDLQMSLRKVIDKAIDAINENKIEADTNIIYEEYIEDYTVSSEDIKAVASIQDENNVELELNQKNVKVGTNNCFNQVKD